MESEKTKKLMMLSGFYVGLLIISNIISVKIFTIFDFNIAAGILTYPLTFLLLNVVIECYSKETAQNLILTGFWVNLFSYLVLKISIYLPPAFFFDDTAFREMLNSTPRIIIACQIAFYISQSLSIKVFYNIKKKFKNLGLSNLGSTIFGQLIDCTTFYIVAFAPFGITASEMNWPDLFVGITVSSVLKIVIAFGSILPFYLLIMWIKGKERINQEVTKWAEAEEVQ